MVVAWGTANCSYAGLPGNSKLQNRVLSSLSFVSRAIKKLCFLHLLSLRKEAEESLNISQTEQAQGEIPGETDSEAMLITMIGRIGRSKYLNDKCESSICVIVNFLEYLIHPYQSFPPQSKPLM